MKPGLLKLKHGIQRREKRAQVRPTLSSDAVLVYRRIRACEARLRLLIDSSSLRVLARVKALSALHTVYWSVSLIPLVYEGVVTQGQRKAVLMRWL